MAQYNMWKILAPIRFRGHRMKHSIIDILPFFARVLYVSFSMTFAELFQYNDRLSRYRVSHYKDNTGIRNQVMKDMTYFFLKWVIFHDVSSINGDEYNSYNVLYIRLTWIPMLVRGLFIFWIAYLKILRTHFPSITKSTFLHLCIWLALLTMIDLFVSYSYRYYIPSYFRIFFITHLYLRHSVFLWMRISFQFFRLYTPFFSHGFF